MDPTQCESEFPSTMRGDMSRAGLQCCDTACAAFYRWLSRRATPAWQAEWLRANLHL
jgi:hypothetical protein